MPLYEGIGTEKLTIILDIGAAYTKLGFSGEYAPRHIIRSEVLLKDSETIKPIFSYNNEEELYELLMEFLHVIFFKYILISPKDKCLLLVESLLCPTLVRETIAKVLFNHYEVASVLFAPSHLVDLAPLAIKTGLVVDVGYTEAVIIPVCHGLPLLHAWQALPIASEAIHRNLKTLLSSSNVGLSNIKEEILEDIKVRCCFVTTYERAMEFRKQNISVNYCPDVIYPIKGTKSIKIDGKIRETAAEVLFEEDNDHQSLSSMILDSILKVNVDLRMKLSENIVIVGGTSMMPGFKARLKWELLNKLESDRYRMLKITKFKFHSTPSKENYTSWLGGAIYGATEILGMKSITRESYFKENRLPDWPNMKDNIRTL